MSQFGGKDLHEEDMTAESIKNQMSAKEWEKVFEMSQDKNLYHNLCTSLFPTVHGKPVPPGASVAGTSGFIDVRIILFLPSLVQAMMR